MKIKISGIPGDYVSEYQTVLYEILLKYFRDIGFILWDFVG